MSLLIRGSSIGRPGGKVAKIKGYKPYKIVRNHVGEFPPTTINMLNEIPGLLENINTHPVGNVISMQVSAFRDIPAGKSAGTCEYRVQIRLRRSSDFFKTSGDYIAAETGGYSSFFIPTVWVRSDFTNQTFDASSLDVRFAVRTTCGAGDFGTKWGIIIKGLVRTI